MWWEEVPGIELCYATVLKGLRKEIDRLKSILSRHFHRQNAPCACGACVSIGVHME